jgi:hypothetical protein
MKRDSVTIDERAITEFVLRTMADRLHQLNIPCPIASFDGMHAHMLIQCVKHNPRVILGIAKQYATAQLKAHRLAVGLNLQLGQGIWGKRSHPTPIGDSRHFQNVRKYIRDHALQGAFVLEQGSLPAPNPMQHFDPAALLIE